MDRMERLSDEYIDAIENLCDHETQNIYGLEECQRLRPASSVRALAKEAKFRGRERDALVQRCELLEYVLNRFLGVMCGHCREALDCVCKQDGIKIPAYRRELANELPQLRSLETPSRPDPKA